MALSNIALTGPYGSGKSSIIRSFLKGYRHPVLQIGDDFRDVLLDADIGDTNRLAVVQSMDLHSLADQPGRAAKVGQILERTGASVGDLDAGAARAVILHSTPSTVQISLLNKCQGALDNNDVREILAALPDPFCQIKTGYHTPRLDKTDMNLELVKWLDARDIISSWGITLFGDAIRINLYRR